MRTMMHFAHGYGASPEAVRDYPEMCGAEAGEIVRWRAWLRQQAGRFAQDLASGACERGVVHPEIDGVERGALALRIAAALDELCDDFLNTGKIDEAEEIA